MNTNPQKTMTCKCGRKHPMLKDVARTKTCGCGREIHLTYDGKATVVDKPKSRSK